MEMYIAHAKTNKNVYVDLQQPMIVQLYNIQLKIG